jgi:hypothetical protein
MPLVNRAITLDKIANTLDVLTLKPPTSGSASVP